jgi:hypothetical protein
MKYGRKNALENGAGFGDGGVILISGAAAHTDGPPLPCRHASAGCRRRRSGFLQLLDVDSIILPARLRVGSLVAMSKAR